MKYGKMMKIYDPNRCIAYNALKRLMKDAPPRDWRDLIYKECARVDSIHLTPNLQVVNTDAFYKLCKKLDKRYAIGALDFYKTCVRNHTFAFTSVSYTTLID